MKKELVQINKLKTYTKFLLENYLDEFVKEDLKRAAELDLPLIKQVAHLPQAEFFAFFKKVAKELFEEIIGGKAIEGSYQLAEKLKANKIEGLQKEKLDIRDVALTYNIRKHSFFKFIPLYTSSIEEGMALTREIEDLFTHRQSLVFQVYTEINTKILKNSEENFKKLAESSFEGIVIHDNSIVLEANQVFASMFGYSREELIGKDLKSFNPESEHIKLAERLKSGTESSYETIALRKDGSLFPIEVMGRVMIYKEEKVRVVGVRDITERKKLEEERSKQYEELQKLNEQLKKEKDFNQVLIDNGVSMILAFDRNMTITSWNKRLEETGIKREDAIGKNYYDLFPTYKNADEWMADVWKGKKVILKDKPFRQRPGYYDAELVPLFNEKNEVTGVLSYFRDVTERKIAETRLKDSEHLLREITDSSPSHIYVFDYVENKSVYTNKELLAFLGYSNEEVQSLGLSPLPKIIHPEDFPKILERQKRYEIAKDDETFYLEYRIKNAKGEWRWHAATSKIFKRTPEGKVWQVLGIANDITEKKEIEEKLLEQKQTFQTILDSIPVLVFWKDDQNNLLGFNKTFQKALDRPANELLTKNESGLHVNASKYLEDDLEVIRTGIPKLNIVEEIFTPEKSFWVKTDKVPLKNIKGETIGVIGSAIDITELQHTQKELHDLNTDLEKRVEERTREVLESEKQYRFLADFVPHIIWTANPEGYIDYYNKNWFEYTGLTFDESKGDGWKKVFHPDDVEKTTEIWLDSIKNGIPYQNEYRYLRASDKRYRWHLGRAVPLINAEGKIVKWFGTSTDIHDQKMAEESTKMQALVLENMDEGVSVSDEKGFIIYTNDAEDRIFGYEPGELHGKHVSVQNDYPPEENQRKVQEVIDQLRSGGSWSGEWRNIKKDGTPFYTFAHITLLRLEEKNLFVCVQRDITEEKKFRETILSQNVQLTQINNDLDNFIYTASHDLKAPVSNIEGLMLTLMDTITPDTKNSNDFQAVTNMMFQSISRFKNTIRDLTDISKAQKNVNEDQTMLNVCQMAEEVKDNISNEIKETNAEIFIDTNNCEVIPFSKKNFRSIIYNLMINAIKYRSPERDPRVSVRTYQTEDYCILEVKDNGLGIKEEHKDKIFQMFKRMHDHVEGSGVGLYIVKRIIDNAGGKIEVDSEEGKGSTFRVYFKKQLQKQ